MLAVNSCDIFVEQKQYPKNTEIWSEFIQDHFLKLQVLILDQSSKRRIHFLSAWWCTQIMHKARRHCISLVYNTVISMKDDLQEIFTLPYGIPQRVCSYLVFTTKCSTKYHNLIIMTYVINMTYILYSISRNLDTY